MVRNFMARGLAAFIVFFSCSSQAGEQNKLFILNWSDYISQDIIKEFEEKTGIDVIYDVFDSNEVLEAKLYSGKTGYDIVFPTARPFFARQLKKDIYLKLDKSKLPNYRHLDKKLLQEMAEFDAGNQYGIPYMWGTTGIGYNIEKIKEIMPDAPVDSLSMIFDPKYAQKFAQCGIAFVDAPEELFPATLAYLGKTPNEKKLDNIKLVRSHLEKIRPYVRYFHSSKYINDLGNGDICIAFGWSGDILQARDRANEADQGVKVGYSIPKEGANMWIDVMAIPKDAPNPDNAHLFLDYIMEPKVIARISDYIAYANGNRSSIPFIDPEIANDPGVYPSEEVMKRLYTDKEDSRKYTRSMNRAWTKIKTSKEE